MDIKTAGKIKGIIWDWNGTLLNDTELAVETMNGVLGSRGLPVLSIEYYKEVFTFPVSDYYRMVGIDFQKEPFEIPALEFINAYIRKVRECSLHTNAGKVLNYFRDNGFRQAVLSAMQQETLDQCMEHYQITPYFEQVSGLDDHYANSKLETGRRMISQLDVEPKELLLVGDTIHDFEVALELGCSCILVSGGHQSHERLKRTGVPVVHDLAELLTII